MVTVGPADLPPLRPASAATQALTRVTTLGAVFSDWVESVKRAAGNPFETAFPTISNDQSGARSYPKGLNEVNARTIKPKVKDFSKDKRIVGIPGFNNFGTPSSKGLPWPFNSDSD